MQPVIMLDRLSADKMQKHSGHRRPPATTIAAAAAVADNVTPDRPSKTSRQQKTSETVSNGQTPAQTGDVPHARSTRSKTTPVSMESTRSRRNK